MARVQKCLRLPAGPRNPAHQSFVLLCAWCGTRPVSKKLSAPPSPGSSTCCTESRSPRPSVPPAYIPAPAAPRPPSPSRAHSSGTQTSPNKTSPPVRQLHFCSGRSLDRCFPLGLAFCENCLSLALRGRRSAPSRLCGGHFLKRALFPRPHPHPPTSPH